MNSEQGWLDWKSITPEEVLSLLNQEALEFSSRYRTLQPAPLTFETPLQELLDTFSVCFLTETRFREFWDIPAFRDDQFQTVGELCEHIAAETRTLEFQPYEILGNSCLKAGVFKTLQALLTERETECEAEIKTTTSVSSLAPDQLEKALFAVNRSLPVQKRVHFNRSYHPHSMRWAYWGISTLILGIGLGILLNGELTLWKGMIFLIASAMSSALAVEGLNQLGPLKDVSLPGVRTIKDLSARISDQMKQAKSGSAQS